MLEAFLIHEVFKSALGMKMQSNITIYFKRKMK